jgi:excinuclease ABC subunit C
MIENGVQVIKKAIHSLSDKPGVYRMVGQKGEVLYVGKAKNLKRRVIAYTLPSKLPNRIQRMIAETIHLEIVTTRTEIEALLLESNLIKKFQPRYNILLKDDKSFPYVLITQDHPFPRIVKHRGPKSIKGKYFGPYASVAAVDECLIMLQKVFLLRNCTDPFFASRIRPCLQYHIKRCSAPCVGYINATDYDLHVKQAFSFLVGKSDKIQQFLSKKMQHASEKLAYEEAAQYRDRLQLLARIQERQRINVRGIRDADVIAAIEHGSQTCVQIFFFRQGQNLGTESFFLTHSEDSSIGEKLAAFINQFYTEREPPKLLLVNHEPSEMSLIVEALAQRYGFVCQWEVPSRGAKRDLIDHALANAQEAIFRKLSDKIAFDQHLDEVAQVFHLSQRPTRIEVYDNSHFQGSSPYGVMIVADESGFNKKAYRKFAIKKDQPAFGGDDIAMMREVLTRRFTRAGGENWPMPDLILLDGGQSQLNIGLTLQKELGIDGVTIVGIAKGPDRHAGRERFFMANQKPFTLPAKSPVLHFLQRLRDEAHRFAIGAHRLGRQKAIITSELDQIPGIGAKRKKALLLHFGSKQGIASASIDELMTVTGINKSVAKSIYNYFHGS